MRMVKLLVVVHVLLIVVVGVLSRVFGDNSGTTLGDWLGLGVLYALVFALPTMIVSVVVAAVAMRLVPGWRHEWRASALVGLLAGPGAAALVIAITNDGDRNGPRYLLGCALVAAVSLGLWAWFGRSTSTTHGVRL